MLHRSVRSTVVGALLLAAGPAWAEIGTGDSAPFSLNTAAISGVTEGLDLPPVTRLGACTPNPFNPSASIPFDLAVPADAHLAVYDLRGRLVRTLLGPEFLPAGRHAASWDGRDDHGHGVAGGVYIYRLTAGDFVAACGMTLVK